MNKIKLLILCILPLIISIIIVYPTLKKNQNHIVDMGLYNNLKSNISIQNINLQTLQARKDALINEIENEKKLQDEKNNLATEKTKINEEITNLTNQINNYNNNIITTQKKLDKINSYLKN